MAGTAEAMLLGARLGLDPELLTGIINTSTGKCWSSEVNNPVPGALRASGRLTPADRDYAGGFASRLMSKDLGLATEAATNAHLSLPVSTIVDRVYRKLAENEDFDNLDFSSIFKWLAVGNVGMRDRETEGDN